MKIEYEENTSGTDSTNAPRDPGDELLVTINLGDIDPEDHEKYIAIAEELLSDSLSDEEVRDVLDHEIWHTFCN